MKLRSDLAFADGTAQASGGLVWRGAWAAGTAYRVNDLATSAGAVYRRVVAGTTATAPESDAVNWIVLALAGATGGSSYSQVIGDGASVAFSVVHGFGTRNVSVSCYLTAAPYNEVTVDVERTDANTVTVRTEGAPIATGAYTVVVAAAGATTQLSSGLNITLDVWHVVGAPGEPGWLYLWAPYDTQGTGRAPRFRKFPDGKVRLAGVMKGTGTAGTVAFTLPVGYRPPTDLNQLANAGGGPCLLAVGANGTVVATNTGSSSVLSYTFIDGVEFDTETVQQTASVAAQPLDSVHYVDTPTGTTGEPKFQGTWVNFGGGLPLVRFRKDPFGKVRLSGFAKSGAPTSTLFTLPVGYCPPQNKYFAVAKDDVAGIAVVGASGIVQSVGTTSAYLSLDGIEFDTETVTSYASGSLPGPALVGALPVSPVDGSECYFQTAAMVTAGVSPWHLRYRASASKWDAISACPWVAVLDGAPVRAVANAFGDLSTAGPSIIVPLAGDYVVDMTVGANSVGAAAGNLYAAGPYLGSGQGNPPHYARASAPGGSWEMTLALVGELFTGVTAGATLKLQYYSQFSTTSQFNPCRISVRPVRVGP